MYESTRWKWAGIRVHCHFILFPQKHIVRTNSSPWMSHRLICNHIDPTLIVDWYRFSLFYPIEKDICMFVERKLLVSTIHKIFSIPIELRHLPSQPQVFGNEQIRFCDDWLRIRPFDEILNVKNPCTTIHGWPMITSRYVIISISRYRCDLTGWCGGIF